MSIFASGSKARQDVIRSTYVYFGLCANGKRRFIIDDCYTSIFLGPIRLGMANVKLNSYNENPTVGLSMLIIINVLQNFKCQLCEFDR